MKKKLFAILLCGVMALGLAGCSNPVSYSKKELEDAKNDLEETYKKYGWVEKETANNGKGISVGISNANDHYEYQVIRVYK